MDIFIDENFSNTIDKKPPVRRLLKVYYEWLGAVFLVASHIPIELGQKTLSRAIYYCTHLGTLPCWKRNSRLNGV